MNLGGRPKVIDYRTVYHKNPASGQEPRSSESDFLGGAVMKRRLIVILERCERGSWPVPAGGNSIPGSTVADFAGSLEAEKLSRRQREGVERGSCHKRRNKSHGL